MSHEFIRHVAFIPNTPLLAVSSSGSEHLIELWNSQTHSIVTMLESRIEGKRQDIYEMAVSQDGTVLVTGGKKMQVWHLPSGGRVAVLNGYTGEINSVSISKDGNRIAAATNNKKVTFWKKRPNLTGQFTFGERVQQNLGDPVLAKVRGPNGEKIMVGGDGPNTNWYFHYYLDQAGNKVMHGDSRVQVNGTSRQESHYDKGVMISRSIFDPKGNLKESYNRLKNITYEKNEYRVLSTGDAITIQSIVTIVKENNSETIKEIQQRKVLSNKRPLPLVSGRSLKVNVNTAGIEHMPRYVKAHNESLSSVKCVVKEDQMIIDFDIDASQWTPVLKKFPLLVRLFDKNGQYLTHFTTAEGFTVFIEAYDVFDKTYKRGVESGLKNEAAKDKCDLLKPKGNRLIYTVNIRDLRDASVVEIGFTER